MNFAQKVTIENINSWNLSY